MGFLRAPLVPSLDAAERQPPANRLTTRTALATSAAVGDAAIAGAGTTTYAQKPAEHLRFRNACRVPLLGTAEGIDQTDVRAAVGVFASP